MSDSGQIWVRFAHKWDKSGTFSNYILVHFRFPSQNVLNFELKKSRICPICVNLTQFGSKSAIYIYPEFSPNSVPPDTPALHLDVLELRHDSAKLDLYLVGGNPARSYR